MRFVTAYAAMQGTRSATEVIEAVERLDRDASVDVIVIARGGGAVEDLLPFSDEALIRAVHKVRTPVVSAIGHEPDSPLLDLVADVRASTPTDAAKLIVPDMAHETEPGRRSDRTASDISSKRSSGVKRWVRLASGPGPAWPIPARAARPDR